MKIGMENGNCSKYENAFPTLQTVLVFHLSIFMYIFCKLFHSYYRLAVISGNY